MAQWILTLYYIQYVRSYWGDMFVMFPVELLAIILLSCTVHCNDVPCDKTRAILSQTSGVITHGPPGTNYSQNTHCEWLIKGN